MTRPDRVSRLLLAIALVAGVTTAVVLLQGGGDEIAIAGVRLSVTSPWRPALVALFCFALYLRATPPPVRAAHANRFMPLWSRPTALAIVLATAVTGAGWFSGSRVGGGADSSGYLSQAQLWREGRLMIDEPLVADSPWPFASETWASLGLRPAANRPSALVPLYPPGLPLLMAAAQSVAGFCAAFLVVPLCGGLVIWLTYSLGRRLFELPGIALWGALLVATSPAFLFQLMNPMSDVPATAAWALALVLTIDRRPLLSGLAGAAAIAIRPNLAPVALVLLAWTALRDSRSTIRLALGLAPGIVGVAALNSYLYGSPISAGYGNAADLYSLGNAPANIRLYAPRLIGVETPIVAFALAFFVSPALVGLPRVPSARLLLSGMLGVVALSYLFYRPYQEWTYLRFLLPIYPILMVLAAAGALAVFRRLTGNALPLAVAACVGLIAVHGVETAAARQAFGVWRDERKYVDVARFIAAYTDPRDVVVSMQHSGSLRFYTGRATLKYDVLEPEWLDRAVAYLESIDRRPYFVLDRWEIETFRRRFAASSRLGALDWNPIAVLPGVTSVFRADPSSGAAKSFVIASTAEDRWYCHVPLSEQVSSVVQ